MTAIGQRTSEPYVAGLRVRVFAVCAALALGLCPMACDGSDTDGAGQDSSDSGGLDVGDAGLDLEPDVSTAQDLGFEPFGDDPDAGDDPANDSNPSPDAQEGVWLTRAERTRGDTVLGERIATYNHNIWWEPAPQLTHALFDVERFRPFPNDRSLVLVSSLDVEAMSTEFSAGRTSYRDALRAEGIVLERSPLDGVAWVMTGHESYHLAENGFGDFAWDLERTDADGRRYRGTGARNEDYMVWDAEVYLPTGGYVVEVIRDAPDNEPGAYHEGALNNMVGVHLEGSFHLYLLHFRQGTIPEDIVPETILSTGTYLGRVGNSGVTLEPHLHVALLWWDGEGETGRSWSVPAEFQDLAIAPSPQGPAVLHEYADPRTGHWISSEPF